MRDDGRSILHKQKRATLPCSGGIVFAVMSYVFRGERLYDERVVTRKAYDSAA